VDLVPAPTHIAAVRISIVIPAFNEERLLGQSLEQIKQAAKAFRRAGWETETIVCDNNSTDRTGEIARAAGATVVFEPVNQISRARNRGAAAATGDWLVFVDADSQPSEGLFSDVVGAIESGKCVAGGATVLLDKKYLVAELTRVLWNMASRWLRLLAGSFIFCDAAVFRKIGGFSQELYATEELELSQRLKKFAKENGRKVVVLHRHPLMTSARKMHLYTLREHLRLLYRIIWNRRELGSAEACHIWYDGRR
jgi:glycosyltransferase involved in cell wall biosynthesis